jgi:hypothetical protein
MTLLRAAIYDLGYKLVHTVYICTAVCIVVWFTIQIFANSYDE